MIVQPSSSRVNSEGALLLVVAFLLVNAPNCHLSLVLALVVLGDAVNCNTIIVLHLSYIVVHFSVFSTAVSLNSVTCTVKRFATLFKLYFIHQVFNFKRMLTLSRSEKCTLM